MSNCIETKSSAMSIYLSFSPPLPEISHPFRKFLAGHEMHDQSDLHNLYKEEVTSVLTREIIKIRSRQHEHTSQCDGPAWLTSERAL
jgi:hypothetical protein